VLIESGFNGGSRDDDSKQKSRREIARVGIVGAICIVCSGIASLRGHTMTNRVPFALPCRERFQKLRPRYDRFAE